MKPTSYKKKRKRKKEKEGNVKTQNVDMKPLSVSLDTVYFAEN